MSQKIELDLTLSAFGVFEEGSLLMYNVKTDLYVPSGDVSAQKCIFCRPFYSVFLFYLLNCKTKGKNETKKKMNIK